jgi:uncharacterized protein YecE (DUF72 family)
MLKATPMEFGKVSSLQLHKIPFSLPSEDERTDQLLNSLTASSPPTLSSPRVYLGCPIWGKKEWVGKVYPAKTQPKDYLKYYSQQFNTIELNSTFYGIPELTTVERWKRVVPHDFLFSPKVFQDISRFEVLNDIPHLTHRFCEAVQHFEKNLGVSFMQLPPHFGPQRGLLILKRFFRLLPKGFSLAVEFRHPDWFDQGKLIDAAFELLAQSSISTVITDVAGRRDVLHQSLTTQTALIRFVGNALHPTDFERMNQWTTRLGAWFKKGVNQVSFFVHEPEEVGSLELMSHFSQELNNKYHLHLKNWDPELAKPRQSELFD